MNWAFRLIPTAVLLSFLISADVLAGSENDRWFSKDKFEHFALSTFYTAGTAKVAHRHFDVGKEKSIAIGAGITISLGVTKEGIDANIRGGETSFKDLIWDAAGVIAGALIAGLTL